MPAWRLDLNDRQVNRYDVGASDGEETHFIRHVLLCDVDGPTNVSSKSKSVHAVHMGPPLKQSPARVHVVGTAELDAGDINKGERRQIKSFIDDRLLERRAQMDRLTKPEQELVSQSEYIIHPAAKEPDAHYPLWRFNCAGFVLNADDPLVADLGRDRDGRRRAGVTYFGIDDPTPALADLPHAHDAKHCRRCGAPYEYERVFVGHLGHYACPSCDANRPRPDVVATEIALHGMSGSGVVIETPAGKLRLTLPIPGLYNVYNALAAVATGLRLGVTLESIGAGIEGMDAVFGRVETVEVGGMPVSILLIKNPAGANEVLRTLLLEADAGGLDAWMALNDRTADGRDVSWIWDTDFGLLQGSVRRVVCSGTRASEMALRLKYAGWPPDALAIDEPIPRSLDHAVEGARVRLFALPTYTALLELRRELSSRGLVKEFWE